MAALTPKQCVMKSIETTSVRGVPRALKEPSRCLRLTWLVVILCLFVLCVISVVSEIQAYVSYPVVVHMEDVPMTPERSELAGFLLCNKNAVSGSKPVPPGIVPYPQYQEQVRKTFRGLLEIDLVSLLASYGGYFQNVGGVENAQLLGHDYTHLVVNCKVVALTGLNEVYLAGSCEEFYDISVRPDCRYFNCYEFALKWNVSVAVSRVELMVHLDNTNNSAAAETVESSGLVLSMRGAPGTSAAGFWTDEAIIPVGIFSKLAFKTEVRHCLPAPHGQCREYDDKDADVASPSPSPSPSPHRCSVMCVQNAMKSTCGCDSSKALAIDDTIFDDPCGKLAGKDDEEETARRVRCMVDVQRAPLENCDCPQACDYYKRYPFMYSMPWPSQNELSGFYRDYIENTPFIAKYADFNEIADLMARGEKKEAERKLAETSVIKENFARLEIRFDRLVQETTELPQITFTGIVSKLGGTLNLFSGISIIIFMEVIDLIVKLCWAYCRSERVVAVKEAPAQATPSNIKCGCNK